MTKSNMEAKITKKQVKMGSKKNPKKQKKKIPHPKGSFDPQFVYQVQLVSGAWKDAKVLDIKRLPQFKKVIQEELMPEHYHYYIHFFNFNR